MGTRGRSCGLIRFLMLAAVLCAGLCGRAAAASIDFKFEIPTIPFPPQISAVENDPAGVGSAGFEVRATITGQVQKKAVCSKTNQADCKAEDWSLIPDPEITPNPPTIAMARVYYYLNDSTQNTKSVDMIKGSGDVWKATVPLTGAVLNDTVTYFIAAVDTRGNVASQEPSTDERPCEDVTSWDASLSTPGIDTCSYATSYSECNLNKSAPAGTCTADYTLADRRGDVCGMPDSNGVQQVISGSDADRLDMLGISAGVDSSKLCAKIGLANSPPEATNPAPIEGYLLIFFNPDIVDPMPADTHITNAYAVTFAPEAVGSDPTLVKDLWDGDCVSNPLTANPLDCRLYAPAGDHAGLKVNNQSGSLRIMVNKSGTGDANLQKSFSLIGNDSNQTLMVGLTGEINLSGGTAFWISDLTPGFALYRQNKSTKVTNIEFNPFVVTGMLCSETGSGGTSNVCPHSTAKPLKNVCTMNFTDKGAADMGITEYRLYRSLGENPAAALAAGPVATKPVGAKDSTQKFDDSITDLNAQNYHYYIGGWNPTKQEVTSLTNYPATHGDCTVDDWTAPAKPVITAAETPPGSDAICRITWTADGSDKSLKDFLVKRDGDVRNAAGPVVKNGDAYVWPDPDTLDVTKSYSYTVVARDKVDNRSESAAFSCTPRDLKPPAQVSSLVSSCAPTPGKLGVTLDWQPSPDSDTKGYNVYACNYSTSSNNCTSIDQFTALNTSLQTQTHFESEGADKWVEAKYRFYISSCDTCQETGTCPATNCTGFPPLKDNFKDHEVMPCIEITAPSAPTNLGVSAAPQGKSCALQWDRVCSDADGAFPDCDAPESKQIVGYKVVQAQSPGVPDPVSGTVVATVAAGGTSTTVSYTHTGLADGVKYYYKVFAFDGSRNYSGGSQEQDCTPARTQKPAAPDLNSPTYDTNSTSCNLTWKAITDPYTISYNVHRCEGDMATCTTAAQFASDFDSGNMNLSGTQYQDATVNEDAYYTYCIASSADGLITSNVYNASDLDNCGQCFTGTPPPISPIIKAWYSESDGSVKISMTKSSDDTGSGGYNIFRCADANCTGTPVKVKACSAVPATGSDISEESPLSLTGEPEGTHYYGATYQPDCGDPAKTSNLAYEKDAIDGPVEVTSVCTGANCITISSCKDYDAKTSCTPVTRKNTTVPLVAGKFALTEQAGLQVFLADKDGNPVGNPATTDAEGNYIIKIDTSKTPVDTTKPYQVVLKIPGGQIPGQPCSTNFAGTDCHVELSRNTTLTPGGAAQARGVNLADCGGGEVGNMNCDDTVNIQDFILLRNCYSAEVGDANYKAYCDVDGSGAVDISDFIAMKSYFGLDLPAAPSCPAAMCSQ